MKSMLWFDDVIDTGGEIGESTFWRGMGVGGCMLDSVVLGLTGVSAAGVASWRDAGGCRYEKWSPVATADRA